MAKKMKYFVLVSLLTFLSLHLETTSASRLPREWCIYIADICSAFEAKQSTGTIIVDHSQVCTTPHGIQHPLLQLLPTMILWAPLQLFHHLLPSGLVCPKCPSDVQSTMRAVGWRTGIDSRRTEPRKIHGTTGVVLLVSRVYTCSHVGHEVIAHHPGVLKQIPTPSVLPFKLWHKTGFTVELLQLLDSMLSAGVTISGIREMLKERAYSQYYFSKSRFEQIVSNMFPDRQIPLEFPTIEQWRSYVPLLVPSRHALTGAFLAMFWHKSDWFVCDMQSSTIDGEDGWLSCDHTFASVGNIGLARDLDSRWITQYKALFCVLNHLGQVVTWRLTPHLTFNRVENVLIALKRRLDSQGKCLKEFYIDNCCSWRDKLQGIFGAHLIVYLDIFHAVKRLGEKIPKRHPLRYECIQDYRMVFRDPTDLGPKRTKITPAPSVLTSNLDQFLTKWNQIQYNGKYVLNTAALSEIRKIRKHINKGCLSGIKPGRGTNRNEALHKELNRIMSSSRYGVELAFALLSTTFFKHNEHQQAKEDDRNERPIEYYGSQHRYHGTTGEVFGLAFKPQFSENANPCLPSTLTPLHFQTVQYCDFLKRIINIEEDSVQMNLLTTDKGGDDEDDGDGDDDDEHVRDEVLSSAQEQDCNDSELLVTEAVQILLHTVLWMFILQHFSECTDTANVLARTLPFMQSALNKFIPDELQDRNDQNVHEEILRNVLTSWNFKRVPVSGDGNCLFYSTAIAIKTKSQGGDKHMQDMIQKLGCEQHVPVPDLAHVLRQSVVKEWLGEHRHQYHSYLTHDQLEKEAERFQQSGQFSGEVGDLAIAALCNVLQTPIVVFSSIKDMPVILLTPTTTIATSADPIHLAYSQYGPGHYDAVFWQEKEPTEQNKEHIKCTCGRNKTTTKKGVSCALVLEHYATKCPCYKAGVSCTDACKCKQCQNPHGTRPLKPKSSVRVGQKRSREMFDTNQYQLKGKKASHFMKEVGEEIDIGAISTFEFLLISAIIQHLYTDIDWTNMDEINLTSIQNAFHVIKRITQQLNMNVPLFSRNRKDIQKALKQYKFQYEFFFKIRQNTTNK